VRCGTGAGAIDRVDSVAFVADGVATFLTIGLLTLVLILPGAAIAAIGVIKMANESRHATDTLGVLAVDWGIDFSTLFDSRRTDD